MDPQSIIQEIAQITTKTYAMQPVVLDRGEGCYAYDTAGKRYLDFAAGIAVASLGHAHPKLIETISTQAAKLMTCQASYATEAKLAAAKLLVDHGCFDQVFFCNSGTESVEAALKMARKWAYDHKGAHANEIITFRNSFHGRTYGAASVTEKALSQPYFAPYIGGVHFAQFNDISSVEVLISDKTAAIIVEPVQGEGGLTPASPCFLRALRNLCDRHKIALIFDEVQCGAGRLGTLFAYESFLCCDMNVCNRGQKPVVSELQPVEPDIICMAKGMGGGFPVGATLAKKQFADALVVGTHGTTYGGNPLACAVVACVIGEMLSNGFMDHVKAMAALFQSELQALKERSNKISLITGKGLMLGIETAIEIKPMIEALRQNGLMTTMAGSSLIRLTPPLIAGEDHIREAVAIIEATLKQDF